MQAHSPVCSTLRIAQKKSQTVYFFHDVIRLGGGEVMVHVSGGRGLYGVSERGGGI